MRGGRLLFDFDKRVSSLAKGPQESKKNCCLIGIDESGRGPWAGPVVACALTLNAGFFHPALNDSKKLSPQLRSKLSQIIKCNSRWAIGMADVDRIDSINIFNATIYAMKQALLNLLQTAPDLQPNLILIDGIEIEKISNHPQESIVKGDSKSAHIAAASVIAKVERDQMMERFDELYPSYEFSKHKGYGTKIHHQNLLEYGPSPIHRRSFSPVKKIYGDFN